MLRLLAKLDVINLDDSSGIHAPYSYWNGSDGFNDRSSKCNYNDKGVYICERTQIFNEGDFPDWMGTPDTWNT